MRLILTALIFCLVAGSFQSCVSKKKYDELVSAKEATDQALAETQMDLKNLQEEKDQLQAEYTAESQRLNNEIQNVRTEMNTQMAAMNEKLSMTEEQLEAMRKEIKDQFDAFEATGLTLEERDGELFLVTGEPFDFSTGSARLSKADRDAIDQLAMKLKDNPSIQIAIIGHTDTQAYPSGSGFDNWDLSWARAKSVASRMIRQGVNPDQVLVGGRGENDPTATNDTREGRAQNRRVEIKPNPALGGFMRAMMDGESMDMDEDEMDNDN